MFKLQAIGHLLACQSRDAYEPPSKRADIHDVERAFVEDQDADAQCYVTLNEQHDVLVCFRGTSSRKDMCIDAKIRRVQADYLPEGAWVHRGFEIQYRALRERVAERIKELDEGRRIIFTGHSLGGALATIGALEFAIAYPDRDVVCVTYGSPRVGSKGFKEQFDRMVDLSYRFVNERDIVPHAPTRWRFSHVRGIVHCTKGRWKFRMPWFYRHSVSDHSIDEYVAAIDGWKAMLGPPPEAVPLRSEQPRPDSPPPLPVDVPSHMFA
mgnify:CR=1 FL=1